jgi:ribosomal-protein-alanine N-acetyltransferase
MFLEVATDNAAARALYDGAGYRRVGLRRCYYPNGGDAVVLARGLSRDATADE